MSIRTPAALTIAAASACVTLSTTNTHAQSTVSGVVILDFEGDIGSGSIAPSAVPINGLTADDLDATFGGTIGAIQDGSGLSVPLDTPLQVNPEGSNLFVSLGADAGAQTTVSLTISELTGTGFVGPGIGDADDTFDGVAATEVAADFYEFAPGSSVTFTYNDLLPSSTYTIASFSSNIAAGIGPDNAGLATVGGASVEFLPAAVGTAGTGTLFNFVDVMSDVDGTLDITFAAPNAGPTFVSGFFIVGEFNQVPEPASALAGLVGAVMLVRRRR
ncbi:MAG: hypothetical protein AAGD32_06975 [Planctomycetota bacterium]